MEPLLIAASISAAISFIVTVTSIFKPLREYLSKIHPKLEELIHCPICFGTWVSLIVVLIGYTHLTIELHQMTVLNVIFNTFAVVGIMGLFHFVLLRAYESVIKLMVQRKLDVLNNQ